MFKRKGSPEKMNKINVQGAVQETPLHCSRCGKMVGTQKGTITVISGKTTLSLVPNNEVVCNDCKGK